MMFTRYSKRSILRFKFYNKFNYSTTSSNKITNPNLHNNDLRLLMNKLIRKLSILPIPDFKKILKNTDLNDNANDTLRCLLILLTKRLERMSSLSFIMLMNPHMAKIWDAYLHSYNKLIKFIGENSNNLDNNNNNNEFPFDDIINFKFENLKENQNFVNILNEIMDMHTDNIVDLRDGIHEAKLASATNSDDEDLFAGISEKQFLDEHLSERVLMRLIANNHILLFENNNNGILDNNLNVLDILSKSIDFVNGMAILKYYEKVDINVNSIIINENGKYLIEKNIDLNNLKNNKLNIIFPYIGNHIEYILNEILKNSTRALIENHINKPIEILILLDKSNLKENSTLQIKISDNGGGIRSNILNKLWEYSFTTVSNSNDTDEIKYTKSGKDIELGAAHDLGLNTNNENNSTDNLVGDNIIAGMGYGLPLSLTYCRLFGGDIKLHTVWGKGTDVYVVLKGI